MRILYVDLNPESIFGRTDKALRSRGHMLFYVSTCNNALETIRNQDFDAVVITQDSLEVLDFIAKACHSRRTSAICYGRLERCRASIGIGVVRRTPANRRHSPWMKGCFWFRHEIDCRALTGQVPRTGRAPSLPVDRHHCQTAGAVHAMFRSFW